LISKPYHRLDPTGTADSTVPSPLPQDGVGTHPQLPLEDDPNPSDPYHQDIDLLTIPHTTIYPGREPSPEQLAHLLSGLVERKRSTPTPLTLDTPFSADRELEESTISVVGDLVNISPQSGHSRTRSGASPTSSRSSRKSLKAKIPTLERRGEESRVQKVEMDRKSDHALTETIRGIYGLWKADRGGEIDKYQFLKVVQEAVEEF